MSGPSIYLGGLEPVVMYDGRALKATETVGARRLKLMTDPSSGSWCERSEELFAAAGTAALPDSADASTDAHSTDAHSAHDDGDGPQDPHVPPRGPVGTERDRRMEKGPLADRRGTFPAPAWAPQQPPPPEPRSTATAPRGRTTRFARYSRKLIEKSSSMEEPGKITTMMVSNLPSWLQQLELIDKLDVSGFAGEFDFCYTPADFTSGKNVGRAFINFRNHGAAMRFKDAWNGSTQFPAHADNWTLRVVPAHIQGRKNNMKMAASRMNVKDPNFKRLVFSRNLAASPDQL